MQKIIWAERGKRVPNHCRTSRPMCYFQSCFLLFTLLHLFSSNVFIFFLSLCFCYKNNTNNRNICFPETFHVYERGRFLFAWFWVFFFFSFFIFIYIFIVLIHSSTLLQMLLFYSCCFTRIKFLYLFFRLVFVVQLVPNPIDKCFLKWSEERKQ